MARHRWQQRGQAIVIMALAMVAICGILALAIDAGRLYFQRRLMQDAVDAGALAGAQDLVGTVLNPAGQPNYALYHAVQDTYSVFNLTPAYNDPSAPPYSPAPPGNTVADSEGNYTVTVVAPSGYNNKQVQVSVTYSAVATFAEMLGFNNINIFATATAEAGTNAKTYAIFAYGGIGTGNTINAQMSGIGQVDNGQDGSDACGIDPAGLTISNAKFHIPNGTPGEMNINGRLVINQGSDNQKIAEFWNTAPPFGTGQDPKPDYLLPDTSLLPSQAPTNRATVKNLAWGASSIVYAGTPYQVTIHNNAADGLQHDFYVYRPGKYSSSLAIPWKTNADGINSYFIFENGIYYFTAGVNLQITGSHVSNTSNGLPHYINGLGATDLPPAPDGTDGVEFIFDGSSSFSADNSDMPGATNGGTSLFFVSPSFVPSGSTHIAFYIASTNTSGTAWTDQNFDASGSNAPRFQIWGTVFDASAGGGSVYLRAVQVGPHNLNPVDSDSSGQYLVNGEFIGFVMTLDMGNVLGNRAGQPPTCSGGVANWADRGNPGLLAQFNPKFAPAPGVNSSLVK
jgi:Flp pilus assembly protein TadG